MSTSSTYDTSVEEDVYVFPASFFQESLWFLDQLDHNGAVYNKSVTLQLKGVLNTGVLEQVLNVIAQRHETLRTTFMVIERQLMQVISPTQFIPLQVVNLRSLPRAEQKAEAQRLATREAQRPFDLTYGPLLRTTLLELGAEEHVLLLTLHHTISDERSMVVLCQELAALYEAFLHDQPSPLPQLPIQYADFAVWHRQWLQGEVQETQLAYWRQQLAGAPALLELLTDHPRPVIQTFRGAQHSFALSEELADALKALGRREESTLFMTLLAAFNVLLHRYTGQTDIVVGSPIANRSRPGLEGLIGYFLNTLVLRTNLSENPTFKEVLRRVREVALEAYAHQDLPFEKLVEELHPERNLSHNPLFQVMFILQSDPTPTFDLPGLRLRLAEVDNETAKFDLSLTLGYIGQGLACSLEYSTDLFEPATMNRMAEHFQKLLEGIVANPEQPISDLPLLTETERRQLLVEWNETRSDYPRDQCIHQLFEAQVQRTPEAVAVVFQDQQLTYRELNAKANQLAHHLQKLGVGPEVLVGICVERSVEMVVGLLAILKAGGAYVPLDPTYPAERLAFMLEDAQIAVLLTQARLRPRLPTHRVQQVCLDTDADLIAQQVESNPLGSDHLDQLAYVIYTSGSTGRPKGVAIAHRSTVAFISWALSVFPVEDLAGVLASTSICFDLSVFEIFVPLSSGGTVILIENLLHLPTLVSCRAVTLINTVPSVLTEVVHRMPLPASVRTVNLAGEPLRRSLVRQLYRQETIQRVFNLYGPTEDTTYSTYALVEPGDEEPSIGRPITNTQTYILDRHLQPVPVGVPGELYLGGAGLARGYLNQPELTAEQFIPNPFSTKAGECLYRTGDLARYRSDGTIEHLGRLDFQVKLRGLRIELGEIEAVLAEHPAVQQAVVVAREEVPGDKRLVAYLVTTREPPPAISELRSPLKEQLPDYMVPSAFVFLEAFPLTPNGKVDRRALPAPGPTRSTIEDTFVAPTLSLHYQLLQIWEELFDVRPIGIRDNFFELGGHSFLATRLISRIEQVFRKKISLATLFIEPTVEHLADALQQLGEEGVPGSWSRLVAVQTGGSKRPFFFLHGDFLNGAFYCYPLARNLGQEQPFYALEPYRFDVMGVPPTLEEMAAVHLGSLRSMQSVGPYLLGGFCNGGLIAYEMARQLHAEGETVDLLILMDPTLVGYRRLMHRTVNLFGNLLRLDQEKQLNWLLWLRHMSRYLHHEYRYLRYPHYRKGITRTASEGFGTAWSFSWALEILLGSEEQKRTGRKGNRVGFTPSRLNALFPEPLFPAVETLRRDWEGIFFWVISGYEPDFYPGKSTFFFTKDKQKRGYDMKWHKVAAAKDKEVAVHHLVGGHETCKTVHLDDLTEHLRLCLNKVQAAEAER
jgi:amino acid adenylation domain-containing protein